MHFRNLIISIALLSGHWLGSQTNEHQLKKDLKVAEDAFERLDYLKAFRLFEKISLSDTSRKDIVFKMGYCLFAINYSDTSSYRYFEKTRESIPESHFFLGRIKFYQGHLKEAIEELYYFKSLNDEKLVTNDEVKKWILSGEQALLEQARDHINVVRNLGETVNTKYAEYVPLVWNVNGSLIFTSRRSDSKGGLKDPYGRYYEDVYVSARKGAGWDVPVSISDSINTASHDACVSISPSGKELLIYRTDQNQTGGDIYLARYVDGAWTRPEMLGPEVNSEYLETSACFSNSGNEIIFSSNRPGGMGGRDLYIVRRFMNGKFSKPYNLGSSINTVEDEDAPFIDPMDNSLYFSSRGHNSIGEYDIFVSKFNEALDKWEKPENLGMPINSTGDDIYFIKQEGANAALFTSRREGGFGDADIYAVNFDESSQLIIHCKLDLSGIVNRNAVKDIQLSLFNTETGKLEGLYRPNKELLGMVLVVNTQKRYKFLLEGQGIEPVVKTLQFQDSNKEMLIEIHDKKE